MLSLSLAQQLKKAGLEWEPKLLDVFAIPDSELDERRFVLTDVMALIEVFRGSPVVTFHGTAEWALDFVLQTEAVWVPSESQLREHIQQYATSLVLKQSPSGFECAFEYRGERMAFTAAEACEAYGSALLQLLWRQDANPDMN